MKKCFALLSLLGSAVFGTAQTPVKWNFYSKRIGEKKFEVHLVAKLEAPWKIYSQSTPVGGPQPTQFNFHKNPILTREGVVKELGQMKKMHEEVFGIDVFYYREVVDFVQIVSVKTKVKTTVSGSLKYMLCSNEECLPPDTIPFTIALQ
jgi:thiol:disulfide interchange protein DsbD